MPDCDLHFWSVIACDQFSGDDEYWQAVLKQVEGKPSSLYLTKPEYFSCHRCELPYDVKSKVKEFEAAGIFDRTFYGYILVERRVDDICRVGLVACVDLNTGDIVQTEETNNRKVAELSELLESCDYSMPHIILLIHDEKKRFIENLYFNRNCYQKIYDFDLLQGGGHLCGWYIPSDDQQMIEDLEYLSTLSNKKMYVGDGNHSVKAYKTIYKRHPSEKNRFMLAEICNLFSNGIVFRSIYRCLMDKHIDCKLFLQLLVEFFVKKDLKITQTQSKVYDFCVFMCNKELRFSVGIAKLDIISILNDFLKIQCETKKIKLSYLNDRSSLIKCLAKGYVCIETPTVNKREFVEYQRFDKQLPMKAFSVDNSNAKRYYLECIKR